MDASDFYNAMIDGGVIDIPIDEVEARILRPGMEAGHAFHGFNADAQEVGDRLIARWRAGVERFKAGEDNVWTPLGWLKRANWPTEEKPNEPDRT